jgi:hypothetical protein
MNGGEEEYILDIVGKARSNETTRRPDVGGLIIVLK